MSDNENSDLIISELEKQVAFSGSAVFSNRFYVTLNSSGVRIAFTERSDHDANPVFRTAVLMSFQDSIELYKVLQNVLEKSQIDNSLEFSND